MACVGWIKQSESTRCDPARERYPAPGQAHGDHADSTRCNPSRIRSGRQQARIRAVYATNIYTLLCSPKATPSEERAMSQACIFMNNRNQAVRLPKDMALPDGVRRVEVRRIGRARLITPVDSVWNDFFDGPGVTEDFMSDRQQPPAQTRDDL